MCPRPLTITGSPTRVMDGRRVTGASLALQINGAKADLRFDTGASRIVVSSRFAERPAYSIWVTRRLAASETAPT